MNKVTSIGINDPTGIKKNVTEILELLANKELSCIVITWQKKDEKERVFWNGDNLKCRGLAAQALGDLTYYQTQNVENEISYDQSLQDEEEDDDDGPTEDSTDQKS